MVIVLSKFWTFTVVSATSSTSPSAPYLGISIQSPGVTIWLADNWMPATNPRIGSLKTSIRTVVITPSPLKSSAGDSPMITESATMNAPPYSTSFATCAKLVSGSLSPTGKPRMMSTVALSSPSSTDTTTTTE